MRDESGYMMLPLLVPFHPRPTDTNTQRTQKWHGSSDSRQRHEQLWKPKAQERPRSGSEQPHLRFCPRLSGGPAASTTPGFLFRWSPLEARGSIRTDSTVPWSPAQPGPGPERHREEQLLRPEADSFPAPSRLRFYFLCHIARIGKLIIRVFYKYRHIKCFSVE